MKLSAWIILVLFSSSLQASNLNQFFNSGGGSTTLTIDQLLAKLSTIDSGTTANIQVSDLDDLNTLFNSGAGMKAVAANSANMNLIAASSTAMNSVASSLPAMSAIASSSVAMSAIVSSSIAMNAIIASSSAMNAIVSSTTAMNAIVANSTALNIIVGSSMAMNTVAASSIAMNAVAGSSTAMNSVAASSTAVNAIAANSSAVNTIGNNVSALTMLVNNPSNFRLMVMNSTALSTLAGNITAKSTLYSLSTKHTQAAAATWATVTTVISGRGLLVRMTTFGNPAGWSEGTMTIPYVKFDGTTTEYTRATATNPYIQSSEHPMRYYATSVALYEYNPLEIAYIPLN